MKTFALSMKLVLLLSLISCDGNSGNFSAAANQVYAFNPAQPETAFTAIADPSAATGTQNRMWEILTAPLCWDASFVGDPTIAGSPASVSQFQFFNPGNYRHVGFSIFSGQIVLHAIGYHNGYDTVIVETWTGDIEALVIVNNMTLVHILKNPSGVPFTTTYGAVQQGCL